MYDILVCSIFLVKRKEGKEGKNPQERPFVYYPKVYLGGKVRQKHSDFLFKQMGPSLLASAL
jgi:hypothetical protein